MNIVILSGRLTADPDIRMGTNDTKIARYILAVERRVKKNMERKSDFITCVCLGKNAEFAEKYLKKGTKVNIRGECRLEAIRIKAAKKSTQMIALLQSMNLQKERASHRKNRKQTHDQYRRQNLVSWMCRI